MHISAVERSGLSGLDEGQKVSCDLVAGRVGKMAAENLTVSRLIVLTIRMVGRSVTAPFLVKVSRYGSARWSGRPYLTVS